MTGSATGAILLKGGTLLVHDDQDHVKPLSNTDLLIQANRIAKIGKGITAPAGAELVNCSGKIISPGFVDTHHHLWQTQLKGCHADQSVFDYIPTGFWQSYAYTPQDMYWGQLGGALEAIDSGTTFVLDHAHGNQSNDHALSATIASGIRSIFAYSHPPYFTKWDSKNCELSRNIMPDSSMAHIFELARGQPYGNGRVHIGFGFDYWFLPRDAVVGIFSGLRSAGIKLFTSHYAKNPTFGQHPLIHTLQAYDLIKSPSDILLSHATGLDAQEKAKLVETKVSVSSTPDTEAQMGFGWPLAFTPGVNYTLGVDCHSNNTSSILSLARSALQMARQQDVVAEMDGADGAPRRMKLQPRGSTQEAFNAATINGARAVLQGDNIGSIKEGKLADLVIFDAAGSLSMSCVAESDPLTAVVRHSDIRDVEAVLIDGVWRKKAGRICPVSVKETGQVLEWPAIRGKLLESQHGIQQRQKNLNLDKAREALVAMFRIDEGNLVKKPREPFTSYVVHRSKSSSQTPEMAQPIPPLITLEEHFVSADLLPALSDIYAEQLKHLPDVAARLTDLGPLRLDDMDTNRISLQVVSHAPGLGPRSPRLSRLANDELSRAVKASPGRLAGFAVLPMAEPETAAAELRRCVKQLGFVGALVDAHVDGVHYDDPRFWPVFVAAAELDVPIYLHPTYPTRDQQSAYGGGYGAGAARSLGSSGFGWHQETGLGVLRLYAAGLFDQVPTLKIIIGHFGEMLPFMMERVEKLSVRWGERQRPWRQVWDENIWITTSGVWSLAPMACILRNTRIDHILYSVDYPFEKNENGLAWVRELQSSGLVTPEVLDMIAYRNAEQLLRVKATAAEGPDGREEDPEQGSSWAGGNLGRQVLDALLGTEYLDVTVLVRRESSPTDYPARVRVVTVDYESPESLRVALQGIDAVVSTLGKKNGLQCQLGLIDAAVAARVKRFIPSEFGADLQQREIRAFPTYRAKVQVEEYLEKKAAETDITYTYIYNSILFEEGLVLGAFGDIAGRKINLFDGGETAFCLARIGTVAQAVVAVLAKYEETRNRAVRIQDLSITPRELLHTVQTLDPAHHWEAVAVDTGTLLAEAERELASGTFNPKAFAAFATRATFAPGLAGSYEGDNKLLGIKAMTEKELAEILRKRLS
ncbi:hypothetical protein ACJ41O_012482 [Fusarium nematophilum]